VSVVETSEVVDETEAWVISDVVGVSAPVDEAVGEADIVVDETVDASVSVVIAEVVVVLAVTSENRFTVPAVVSDNVSDDLVVGVLEESSSLSGQIPVVHGSLEQHPRKSPTVQTYHCLPPVQVLTSRAKRNSRESISRSISDIIIKVKGAAVCWRSKL